MRRVQPSDYPLNPFKMKFDPPLFHPNSALRPL
jgi:ubiquitin-protein ligase